MHYSDSAVAGKGVERKQDNLGIFFSVRVSILVMQVDHPRLRLT